MTRVVRSALVPFSADAMYRLVEDVERYPQFLPWCASSQVHERVGAVQVATLGIDFHGVKQSFTTENRLTEPSRIELRLRQGPFASLEGVWTFKELAPDACRIDFSLDYELRNGLIARLMGKIFGQIAQSMMDAFIQEAERRAAQGS